MNLLFFSDLHIKKEELKECALVLEEIGMLCNEYKIDKVFNLGDTFDKINPESECLDLFASFIRRLNRPMTILAANSHESTTYENSVVNHFGILSDNIEVMKKCVNEDYLFCGHFIVNESSKNYGGTVPKKDLGKYNFAILGHGHSFEIIKPNICQLGSVRYIDFAESQDKFKTVAVCLNYRTEGENWQFLPLKSPYPMKDVVIESAGPTASSSKESEGEKWSDTLQKLPEKTKVRVIFNDFESYSNSINELEKFRYKFILFREKKNFLISVNNQKCISKEMNLKESMSLYLDKNKVNDIIKKILLEEIK